MTTPAGGELVGTAEIRVDADTDPAIRALGQFSRDAQRRLREVERSVTATTSELRELRTTAQSIAIDVNIDGLDAIRNASQSMRDLNTQAQRVGTQLRVLTTRTTAATAALELLENAAQSAARALRTLRGRAAAVSTSLSELTPAARTASNSLAALGVRAHAAGEQVNSLDERSRTLRGSMDSLGGAVAGVASELADLRGGLPGLSVSLGQASDAGRAAGALRGVLGRIAVGLGAVGTAAGSAVPLLASMVATLEQISPAGAVATTGMLAIVQASTAIKLSMIGVEDAVEAAFDTSKEGAKKFKEALEKLSPNARTFVQTIRGARDELIKFQQSVQDKLFTGFGKELKALSTSVVPEFQHSLGQSALSLNHMALGVSSAVRELAASGTLGDALAGANQGLANLEKAPGRLVTAFGQLAAAAAPAFERITVAIDKAVTGFADRIAKGFESGKLTESIDNAIDVLKDLGTVASNIFGTLRNVIAPVQTEGEGLVGTLVQITGALREATASEGFQQVMGALVSVTSTLGRTLGTLINQSLAVLGPVFTTLGPPVQRLIEAFGSGLGVVIEALGPVLMAAAGAVGALADALSPLLPIAGQLIAAVLPVLTPLFDAVRQVIEQLAPVVQKLALALTAALTPVLAQLPVIVQPLLDVFTGLAEIVIGLLSRLVTVLAPSLAQMGQSFGELLAAVGPLLPILGQFAVGMLGELLSVLGPVITLVGRLAAVFASQMANTITNIVAPALRLVVSLLRGDFSMAWENLKQLVAGVGQFLIGSIRNMGTAIGAVVRGIVDIFKWLYNTLIGNSIIPDLVNGIRSWFGRLPGMVFAALRSLAGGLARIATGAMSRFRSAVVSGGNAALAWLRGLPGRIRSAVSSLGGLLSGVARSALSRFRSAVASGASSAVSVARSIPGRIRSAMGSLGSLLYGAGQDIVRGMINGLSSMAGSLAARARSMAASAVAAAKRALGISSPSRVFVQIGRDVGRGFIKGLTGTKRQIDQTADRVAASITRAFRGTGSRLDNRLVASIQRTNRRLQRLSVERDRIAKSIADARKFATDIAARARGTGSLGAIVQPDFFAPRFVEARMRSALASIRRFTANVEKLRKRGLSRSLLRQVLELGPTQGAGFAASLAAADKATIQRFNRLQSSISKASTKLGRRGADLLFDSGKKASQGFLAGLRAQQKSIEALMLRIAKGMQRSIRRALGIRSPSRVMAEVGQLSGLGLAGGLAGSVPVVNRAMNRLAGAVAGGVPARLTTPRVGALAGVGTMPARRATGGGMDHHMPHHVHIHVHNAGVIGSRRELDNWLVGSIDRLRLQKRLRLEGG